MDKQKIAAAIMAARKHNIPHFIVCTDMTADALAARYKQAQIEHPLQRVHVIEVIYE